MNLAKPLKYKNCVRYKFMNVSNLLFCFPSHVFSYFFQKTKYLVRIYYPVSVQYARSMFFEVGVRWPGPL